MAMTSCAVVEEIHHDGTTTRSLEFAAPVIALDQNSQGLIVKATGLGFLLMNGSATLGFFNETRITLDPECRIVLIDNTEEQLRHFAELSSKDGGLCFGKTTAGGTQ
jgi:hypothetical protein